MKETLVQIAIGNGRSVSALHSFNEEPEGEGIVFVYAPGAGSNLRDPFGVFLAGKLAAARMQMLRFQFPYSEAGRSVPDNNSTLEATWLAVLEASRSLAGTAVAGGRSMGGRIASQVVSQGIEVDGLVLFAYPLHPPGRPDKRRDEHLRSIMVPTLFCSGTRDTFGSPDELEAAAALVQKVTVHFVVGADHGFNTLKSSGLTRADVWSEAWSILSEFLTAIR